MICCRRKDCVDPFLILVCSCLVSYVKSSKDRAIPLEYSCDSLPFELKDTDLHFNYSAKHLTRPSCSVKITGGKFEKICVKFVKYLLDCNTKIIFIEEINSSMLREEYRCDSAHSSDFCSKDSSTLEVVFERKNGKHNDMDGRVEIRVYGKDEIETIPTTNVITVTVLIVVGSILGSSIVLLTSAYVISRVVMHMRRSAKRRQYPGQRHQQEEIPLGPPPPYEETDPLRETATVAD